MMRLRRSPRPLLTFSWLSTETTESSMNSSLRSASLRMVSIRFQSDTPEYDCAAVRPCTASPAAPASSSRRARSGAFISASFQPARIFTVTGIFTARAIARTTSAACSGSRIRLQPALCFAIFGTGQPMFTSTISAPMPSTTWAAAAIFSGSPPKI